MTLKLGAALLGAALLMGGGVGDAFACAICLSAMSVSTGQKLDASDQVALATSLSAGRQFQLAETIKGDVSLGSTVEASANHSQLPPPEAGKLYLIARNGMSGRWTNYGLVKRESAAWLREILKTNDGRAKASRHAWPLVSTVQALPDTTNWSDRIGLITPYLENNDPLVAEIAFGELSRAPYESLRGLKSAIDTGKVRRWIDDPALEERHDAYLLLLGVAGGPDDAAMMEQRLVATRSSHDASHVAAMLAADLELRGASRLAWIEDNYLLDQGRSLPEIEATLLALNVHGGASGDVVPQQKVVDAYRHFIRARKPMAGFVATYLSDWKAWDAVPDYIEVLRSNAVTDPAEQFAIVVYLKDSPSAEAQAAAAAFSAQSN